MNKLVDALDVLWLIGMKTEIEEVCDWLHDTILPEMYLYLKPPIRSLGGLLSAYNLRGRMFFSGKAGDLGLHSSRDWNATNRI